MNLASKFLRITEWGLVALIGYTLFKAVLVFLEPSTLWRGPDLETFSQPEMLASPVSHTQSVAFTSTFDAFHREGETAAKPSNLGEAAPETSLNLKVRGRRYFADESYTGLEAGSATIETPDKKQAVYRPGDEIMRNVTLEAVERDYIVLSQDGRLERLTIAKNENSPLLLTSSSSSLPINIHSVPLNTILSGIDFNPVIKNGNIQGLRISSKSNRQSLRDFGFQNGDIMTHIGGIDIRQSPSELATVLSKLNEKNFNSSSSLIVRLKRGNRTVTVKLGS